MDNEKLMTRLAALPDPDFMHASKLTDPIGSDSSYRADTVARLIDEAVKAERDRCSATIDRLQQAWEETRQQRDDLLAHIAGKSPLPAWADAWLKAQPQVQRPAEPAATPG